MVVAGLSPHRRLVKTWHRPLRWAGQSLLPIKSLKPYPPNISPSTNSYIFSSYHLRTSPRTRKHIKNTIKSPKKAKIDKKHHLVQWYEDKNQKKNIQDPI